jgi:hypothetical protein
MKKEKRKEKRKKYIYIRRKTINHFGERNIKIKTVTSPGHN